MTGLECKYVMIYGARFRVVVTVLLKNKYYLKEN